MLQNMQNLTISFVASSLLLAALTVAVTDSKSFSVSDRLLHRRFISEHKTFPLKGLSTLLAPKADVVWCAIIAGVVALSGNWLLAVWCLATLGLADVCGLIIKYATKRRRPYNHLPEEHGFSFPSGHVLGFTSLTLILLRLYGGAGIWLPILLVIFWALLVKARLQLGAHYPADILASIQLAIACFSATSILYLII